MKLTFIPAPGSPCRVLSADDPQPEESWSSQATNKRIAPPPCPTTPADDPRGAAEHSASAHPPSTLPCPSSTEHAKASLPASTHSSDFLEPLPPPSCPDCPDRPLLVQTRQQAHYYRAIFAAAKQREAKKAARIAELEAEIRILKQRLFGSKSESHHSPDRLQVTTPEDPLAEGVSPAETAAASSAAPSKPRRRRGQQKGNPIPPRRDYSHLPVITEERILPPEEACCSCCGKPFSPGGYEEDSEIIEVEVKAYRRRIRRKRYRRTCSCSGLPTIVSAPVAPRVLPHTRFGVSVWVQILLDKYNYARATHKQLDDLRGHDLDLASGTIIGDLKRLAHLFEPLYQKLLDRSRERVLWNADETRWPVFQVVAGKVGHRWYLWLFESKDSVVFTLDKGRGHDVPENHFGEDAIGIVVVDRYSAYKAMKHVKEGRLRLAFCWAHQRRDFLDVEKSWPKLSDWATQWVARIAQLYRRNDERLAAKEKSQDFTKKDNELREAVAAMRQRWEEELADEKLHPAKRKVLSSMKDHWGGLTIFVDELTVPMDNNRGERTLRIAALCRKNYYGSGAEWSGKLATGMFSILATLKKWRINPRKWLTGYLQACAEAGSKVPEDVEKWLPWNLSALQKKAMGQEEEEEEEEGEASQREQ
jgi:transposase